MSRRLIAVMKNGMSLGLKKGRSRRLLNEEVDGIVMDRQVETVVSSLREHLGYAPDFRG